MQTKRVNFTQQELADLLGTKQPVIARLENTDYEGHVRGTHGLGEDERRDDETRDLTPMNDIRYDELLADLFEADATYPEASTQVRCGYLTPPVLT